jgi:nanoRNase/pAp phosphatase (c-di-AMP/oligoRNAs hydrolase)
MEEENVIDSNGDLLVELQETLAATPTGELLDVLRDHRGERHVIVLQDFPDPDAISSASAHRLISGRFDIETDIVYNGRISHQQNIALVRLLNIDLIRYNEDVELQQYDGAVFVDNQGTTCSEMVEALEKAEVPALIVVDHHEEQELLEPAFRDVRRAGATATIYAEYIEKGLIDLDPAQEEHVVVATALTHGILTDTNGFIRAGAEDFHAAAYLSGFRDAEILGQVMSQARSRQAMDIIREALASRVVKEGTSIAGIGYLRLKDRDAIPQAAEFLLTEENVFTAIVYGIMVGEDRHESVIGSMRTTKLTIDPDEFIKDVFGKDVTGRYFGGGKQSAGAFEIPIGFLAGDGNNEYRARKWQVYDAQIKQKLFTRLGIEVDPMEAEE